MTGVRLEIDSSSIERLQDRLAGFSGLPLNDLRHAIGSEVEHQTRRRLQDEKTTPDGDAWQALDEGYAARKALKSSGGILERDGDLIDSIAYAVDGDEIEIGSPLVYAAIQHFGGDEVGIPIVSRQFLGLSQDNENDLLALVDQWLDQQVGGQSHAI
ncbi:Uncharacterised protein [BD1-7 clade bacterium]|uniref:Phage virion morphogenesis protein n=1 Tax=BD1-7 clade bacterium TaxID=2029982 RepID=A0A5S9Q4A3_9GAMM|nr:Uncharacterised protein [BD1-7 clade bacterium]CAA0111733.1 Uncharacterised protein [BD1-7 clade bacterium]